MIHDAAFLLATELLATVKDCLHEQEHRDAFEDFFTICKRNLQAYEIQAERMPKRLGASRN